jgi:hypothetical protein
MLYPELLPMIAECLQGERTSIASLSAVNKTTYRELMPVLYSKVVLEDLGTIVMFCRTILSMSSSRCHDLVKNLWIGPSRFEPFADIVPNLHTIRSMLSKLVNLRDLTLTPTTPMLASLYTGLECTFQLTRLACTCHRDEHFVAFLKGQSSITHLELGQLEGTIWGSRGSLSLAKHYNNIESQNMFLPRLTSITADAIVISTLCPGRPIEHVQITEMAGIKGETLAASVALSTAAVYAIEFEVLALPSQLVSLFDILTALKSTPLSSTLREMKIRFNLVSTHLISW